MNVTLVRNATMVLELAERRILVDPMLDPAGARPPIEQTASPVRNPTVELPFPAEMVVSGLDAVLVTQCHKDDFDETAEQLLPRDVPVFCQPEDEERLRAAGSRRRSRPSRCEGHPEARDAVPWPGLAGSWPGSTLLPT